MKFAHLAAGLCLFLSACGGPAASSDLSAALDAQLRANAERYGPPAQSVLVLHNGAVLYRNQIGLADVEAGRAVRPDDVYGVYSVSKLFASTLILELADKGRLDLKAPAARYVPTLPAAWREVQVDQLLSHVSGLPDFVSGADDTTVFPSTRDEMFRVMGERPFDFPTGTQARYNQTNYVVLQAVLEAVYGMSYRDIVRSRIVEPLGLKDVYLGVENAPRDRLVSPYHGEDGRLVPDRPIQWRDYSVSHAELYTTADDLGRFLTAVAQGRFARQETLARLWRPYPLPNGGTGFASGWDYGESGDYREVGHDGSVKVRVRLLFRGEDLSDHYIIVYLTNGTPENTWTRTFVDSIQPIILRAGISETP